MPDHHVGDLAQGGPYEGVGAALEGGDQVGEEPGPPQAAASDDHAVAAGLPHHAQRVLGGPDVAVAEDGDLRDVLLEAGDGVPVGGAAVVLGGGAAVQGDGADALLDGDAARVEVGEVVVVDALAHLHGDGQVTGAGDGLADDGPQQVPLVRQRRAAALAGHLRHRAAEVQVDVVGEALLRDHADGLADGHRVDAVQLDRAWGLGRVEVDQLHGLLVALDQRPGGDHLAHEQALAPAELPAQRAERRVGDPGHRRQHHGRRDGVRADAQGCGGGVGGGRGERGHSPIVTHTGRCSPRPVDKDRASVIS